MDFLYHGVGVYQPGEKIGPAQWPHFDLLACIDGEVGLSVAGEYFCLQAADVILIPPNHRFFGEAKLKHSMIWVCHFSGYTDLDHSDFVPLHRLSLVPQLLKDPLLESLSQRVSHAYPQANLEAAAALSSLLNFLIVRMHKQAGIWNPDEPFAEVLSWAAQQLGKGVQVADMAHRAGLSLSHFRSRFRAQYGHSPATALARLRLRIARQLLVENRLCIKEIASQVGYSDVVAFHRAFRRSGQTPAQYRQQHRLKV